MHRRSFTTRLALLIAPELDATIRRLRDERDGWQESYEVARTLKREAKATLAQLNAQVTELECFPGTQATLSRALEANRQLQSSVYALQQQAGRDAQEVARLHSVNDAQESDLLDAQLALHALRIELAEVPGRDPRTGRFAPRGGVLVASSVRVIEESQEEAEAA